MQFVVTLRAITGFFFKYTPSTRLSLLEPAVVFRIALVGKTLLKRLECHTTTLRTTIPSTGGGKFRETDFQKYYSRRLTDAAAHFSDNCFLFQARKR